MIHLYNYAFFFGGKTVFFFASAIQKFLTRYPFGKLNHLLDAGGDDVGKLLPERRPLGDAVAGGRRAGGVVGAAVVFGAARVAVFN